MHGVINIPKPNWLWECECGNREMDVRKIPPTPDEPKPVCLKCGKEMKGNFFHYGGPPEHLFKKY